MEYLADADHVIVLALRYSDYSTYLETKQSVRSQQLHTVGASTTSEMHCPCVFYMSSISASTMLRWRAAGQCITGRQGANQQHQPPAHVLLLSPSETPRHIHSG
ncbi:hypothetical protein PMIN04_005758 [Paraphaeosphaeria minitans]